MFPGWENEPRGNRWHFAVRWAKRLPVVLVQPTLAFRSAMSQPEPRIPNSRVFRIRSAGYQEDIAYTVQVQVAQVLKDMAEHDFHRPLLWQYNPNLAGLCARIPAVARVYHASEAHFLYTRLDPFFLVQMRSALKLSDLTVAVSAGVADSIRARVPEARIATVTNGCDFNAYIRGKPDTELLSAASGYRRIAIYAGNINERLDFNLIDQLAASHPDVLFAMYGRVADLGEDIGLWKRALRRDNVLAPGAIDPDRLPICLLPDGSQLAAATVEDVASGLGMVSPPSLSDSASSARAGGSTSWSRARRGFGRSVISPGSRPRRWSPCHTWSTR